MKSIDTMIPVNTAVSVSIKANFRELREDRRIELEEAIEMALSLIYRCKSYADSPDYPDDWKALAAALENVKGI